MSTFLIFYLGVTEEVLRVYVGVRKVSDTAAKCACIPRGWGAKLLGFVDGTNADGSTPAGLDAYTDTQANQMEFGAYVYALFNK